MIISADKLMYNMTNISLKLCCYELKRKTTFTQNPHGLKVCLNCEISEVYNSIPRLIDPFNCIFKYHIEYDKMPSIHILKRDLSDDKPPPLLLSDVLQTLAFLSSLGSTAPQLNVFKNSYCHRLIAADT